MKQSWGSYWLLFTGLLGLVAPWLVGPEGIYPWPAGSFDSAAGIPPFQQGHLLGTDGYGRDVLAGLIQACRSAWALCLPSAFLAGLVGIILGILELGLGRKSMSVHLPALLVGLFIGLIMVLFKENFEMLELNSMYLLLLPLAAYFVVSSVFPKAKRWRGGSSVLEASRIIITSIPGLWLLLMFSDQMQKNYVGLIVLIACTSWVGMARLTRSEGMRLLQTEWMMAAGSLGLIGWRFWFNHLFRNIFPAIWPAWLSIFAGCLLLESSLAFLGVGLPDHHIGWGSMLRHGKDFLHLWWVMLMPAIFLSLTIGAAFHLIFSLKANPNKQQMHNV